MYLCHGGGINLGNISWVEEHVKSYYYCFVNSFPAEQEEQGQPMNKFPI
jgi:hypothetical protein